MKPKLLLIAYRAWGDWLYTVPVLPYLFKWYDVYLETNFKISQLVYNDTRFKDVSIFLYEQFPKDQWSKLFPERWAKRIDEVKPDRVINLNGTLEVKCIGERFQREFYLPLDQRRQHFGNLSFYDSIFDACQIPIPKEPKLDELFYSSDEIGTCVKWREKKKDKFIVIIPIAGSTSQKVLHFYKDWTFKILDRIPDAEVYLAGDLTCEKLVPNHPHIKNMCKDVPIKQSFLMTKYANYVLGPETGVLVAAGMWGTPKTMLCTTSSIYQCTKYQKNDYSIQAPIMCSPCHRAIYFDNDCHTMLGNIATKTLYPACTKTFEFEKIYSHIEKIYLQFKERGNFVPPPFEGVPSQSYKVG